jgi:hypothetical protein
LPTPNKKAELAAGSFMGSPAIFELVRPIVFCPHLTMGLAFMG